MICREYDVLLDLSHRSTTSANHTHAANYRSILSTIAPLQLAATLSTTHSRPDCPHHPTRVIPVAHCAYLPLCAVLSAYSFHLSTASLHPCHLHLAHCIAAQTSHIDQRSSCLVPSVSLSSSPVRSPRPLPLWITISTSVSQTTTAHLRDAIQS